jgi:hypothetical protein|tara:strand:+ start:2485 stop:2967 length:483 start_codon:yes stop_codon:yes gene_type:complete
MKNAGSVLEGTAAEQEFIRLRGKSFIRRSTKEEDIHQHWDVMDKEFGMVDVKAAKRRFRGGPVDYTIWWELKTVKRPPEWKPTKGWGVPNDLDRLIAVRSQDGFHLVNPSDIIDDLRRRCTEYFRGDFGLHTRPSRGDLMTILPLSYIKEYETHFLELLS